MTTSKRTFREYIKPLVDQVAIHIHTAQNLVAQARDHVVLPCVFTIPAIAFIRNLRIQHFRILRCVRWGHSGGRGVPSPQFAFVIESVLGVVLSSERQPRSSARHAIDHLKLHLIL